MSYMVVGGYSQDSYPHKLTHTHTKPTQQNTSPEQNKTTVLHTILDNKNIHSLTRSPTLVSMGEKCAHFCCTISIVRSFSNYTDLLSYFEQIKSHSIECRGFAVVMPS